MKCPNCNTENPADYAFCLSCGNQLPKSGEALVKVVINQKLAREQENRRKKGVDALVKLYTDIAVKTRQPTILHFNTDDPRMTTQAVLKKIDTATLEKIYVQAKKDKFMLRYNYLKVASLYIAAELARRAQPNEINEAKEEPTP